MSRLHLGEGKMVFSLCLGGEVRFADWSCRAVGLSRCDLARGRTSQTVSKPCMILNKAWWGDQMVAHKARFFSGLYKAHSVRPDSIHPDYRVLRRPGLCAPLTELGFQP